MDEIPLDHPIWKLILPDVLSVNIPKLINDNPDYFHHQLGKSKINNFKRILRML